MGNGYKRLFKSVQTLLIYQRGSVREFTERLELKTDTINVTDFISADEDMETVKKKIDSFDNVVLWDISTAKRNSIFKYCYENSKRIYSAPNIPDIIMNGATPVHLFDSPLLLTDANPLEYE